MPDDIELQLQRMMQQFQTSPEELERARQQARRDQILASSLGLLGTRKGQEFESLGRAGLFGQGVYNDTYAELSQGPVRQRQQAMQAAAQAMQLRQQMQGLQNQQATAETLRANPFNAGGVPGQSQQSTLPAGAVGGGGMGGGTAAMFGGGTQPGPVAGPSRQMPADPVSIAQARMEHIQRIADANPGNAQIQKMADDAREAFTKLLIMRKTSGGVQTMRDPSGQIYGAQGMEYGMPQRTDMVPAEKIDYVNAGGTIQPRGTLSGQLLAPNIGVTNTPAQDAAARIAEGQLGVSRGQLGVAQAAERRAADTAKEGRWANDFDRGVQVGPGGVTRQLIDQAGVPLAPKGSEQLANMKRGAVEMADRVLAMTGEVRTALEAGGTGTGTVAGAVMRKVPGTPAYDLAAKVDSIRANLGFEQLTALRAASPTGGALGAVSEQENRLLQATIANLDPNQSDAELRKQITKVEYHLQRVRQLMAGQQPAPMVPDAGAPAQQQRTGTIGGPGWSAVRVSPGGR